jgi:HK97 family phage major capsid protein
MPTLNEARSNVRAFAQKGLDVVNDATLTPAEQKDALDKIDADLKKWQAEVADLEHVDELRKNFVASTGQPVDTFEENGPATSNDTQITKSLGDQFIESAAYKNRQGNRLAGSVELKTTLTEGTVGSPGPGYAIPNAVPNLVPGIVDIKFQELTIADLFPQGTTESPLIRYLVETAVTNAAAAVAEGWPEAGVGPRVRKVDEVLHKIPTFLPISDEMLEDWAQAMSYIDARLGLFVNLALQSSCCSATGPAPTWSACSTGPAWRRRSPRAPRRPPRTTTRWTRSTARSRRSARPRSSNRTRS